MTLPGFPKSFQTPQLAAVDGKWNSLALSYPEITWAEAVVNTCEKGAWQAPVFENGP